MKNIKLLVLLNTKKVGMIGGIFKKKNFVLDLKLNKTWVVFYANPGTN